MADDLVFEFRTPTDKMKGDLAQAKSLVRQFGSETEREDAASRRRLSSAQLRELQRSHREQQREHSRAARQAAAEYEKELGPGLFSRLARAATKSFREGFKVGGESFGGGGLLSGALSVATGNILSSVLGGVTSQITGGIKAGFDFNKLKEQSLLSFEIKLKGRKEAEDFFNQVSNFAEDTPLELDQALNSVQKLMVAFTAPEALRSMRAITDVVAKQAKVGGEAQEAINGIGLQLQQILLKNKLQQEELVSLAERQIDVYGYLTKGIAKENQEFAKLSEADQKEALNELVRKGMIDARAAVATIVKGMEEDAGGTAARIAKQTAEGMESNIKDSMTRTAGIATESAFAEYKKFLERTLNLLNTGAGEKIAGGISATTGGLFAGFEKTLQAVTSGNLGQLGLDAVSSAAEGVKSGAQKLYDAGAGAAGQVEQGWRDRLQQHSPSQIMLSLGYDAGASLVEGFLQGTQGQRLGDEIERLIEEAAARYGLDPNLIRAVMKRESSGRREIVSPKGASGLMQLMPGTAARYGATNIFDPAQNIDAGAHYLADLIKEFKDLRLALAAYNAGEGAVRKYGNQIPPYKETQAYVPAVMRYYTRLSTGVDAPFTQSNAPDTSRELAELTKAREEINAETLDHLEVLQLEQLRLGRWFAALTKEMGKGPMSEAASSDIIKRKAELEAAMDKNAREMESYWLSQLQIINALDEKIKALKGRALDTSAQDGGSFRPGSFLNLTDEQVRHVQELAQGAIDKARQGVITVSNDTTALAQTVVPQALTSVRLVAQETANTFRDIPPLIKQSKDESSKAAQEIAQTVSGMFGGLVQSALRGQWREGLKGLRDDFINWTISLFQDWVQSRIFKALSPKGIAGGTAGGGGSGGGFSLGSIFDGLKGLFNFGSSAAGGGAALGGAASAAGTVAFPVSGLTQASILGSLVPSSTAAGLGTGAAGARAGAAAGFNFAGLGASGLLAGGSLLGSLAGGRNPIGQLMGSVGGTLLGGTAAAGIFGNAALLPALFSNPVTAIVGGALIGGALLTRLFGGRHKTEKALRETIDREYGVRIHEMEVLTQIKQMGEARFGKGNVRQRLSETIHLPEVMELIKQYAESTNQFPKGALAPPEPKLTGYVEGRAGTGAPIFGRYDDGSLRPLNRDGTPANSMGGFSMFAADNLWESERERRMKAQAEEDKYTKREDRRDESRPIEVRVVIEDNSRVDPDIQRERTIRTLTDDPRAASAVADHVAKGLDSRHTNLSNAVHWSVLRAYRDSYDIRDTIRRDLGYF